MSFEFLNFDDERFSSTVAAWQADADNGLAFSSEILRLFDWVNTHREMSEVDSMAFGVFPKNESTAVGICEVMIHRKTVRSRRVKLLRLHLKPSADADLQAGESDLAMMVFTQCLVGTIGLQLKHQAKTLKVYGRTPEQLAFLRVLVSNIDKIDPKKSGSGYKAAIEGRFLSITIN
jgi:hypothetical protein